MPNLAATRALSLCVFMSFVVLISTLPWGSGVETRYLRTMEQPAAATAAKQPQLVVYIFDTKVRRSHSRLRGRVEQRVDFDSSFEPADHGTFISSLVVENLPETVVIVSLAVIDGRPKVGGSSMTVLYAMEFALQDKQKRYPDANAIAILCVAGLSKEEEAEKSSFWRLQYDWLAWFRPNSFDGALLLADANNFATVIAAGNHYNKAVCRQPIPASLLMVGSFEAANNAELRRADYSNFGPCVSVFAKGTSTGASAMNDEAMITMSGTSVSAAVVANRLAQFWLQRPTLVANEMVSQFLESLQHDNNVQLDLVCHKTKTLAERQACEQDTTTMKRVLF